MHYLTSLSSIHPQSLLICASAGDTDHVAKLLNRGANIEARNEDGQTALLVAAKRGHLGVVDILLKNHADVDGTDSTGLGAIHLSSENGQWQMVKLLLKNSKTHNFNMPFYSHNSQWNLHIGWFEDIKSDLT